MHEFELLDHTADVAIRLVADDEAGLLCAVAAAVGQLYAGKRELEGERSLDIRVEASKREELLVRFANELIFLFDSDGALAAEIARCVVSRKGNSLIAEATLDLCDCRAIEMAVETDLKAATYHDLEVEDSDGRLQATLVIDT